MTLQEVAFRLRLIKRSFTPSAGTPQTPKSPWSLWTEILLFTMPWSPNYYHLSHPSNSTGLSKWRGISSSLSLSWCPVGKALSSLLKCWTLWLAKVYKSNRSSSILTLFSASHGVPSSLTCSLQGARTLKWGCSILCHRIQSRCLRGTLIEFTM